MKKSTVRFYIFVFFFYLRKTNIRNIHVLLLYAIQNANGILIFFRNELDYKNIENYNTTMLREI